jgi:hypothetical protein
MSHAIEARQVPDARWRLRPGRKEEFQTYWSNGEIGFVLNLHRTLPFLVAPCCSNACGDLVHARREFPNKLNRKSDYANTNKRSSKTGRGGCSGHRR